MARLRDRQRNGTESEASRHVGFNLFAGCCGRPTTVPSTKGLFFATSGDHEVTCRMETDAPPGQFALIYTLPKLRTHAPVGISKGSSAKRN